MDDLFKKIYEIFEQKKISINEIKNSKNIEEIVGKYNILSNIKNIEDI